MQWARPVEEVWTILYECDMIWYCSILVFIIIYLVQYNTWLSGNYPHALNVLESNPISYTSRAIITRKSRCRKSLTHLDEQDYILLRAVDITFYGYIQLYYKIDVYRLRICFMEHNKIIFDIFLSCSSKLGHLSKISAEWFQYNAQAFNEFWETVTF